MYEQCRHQLPRSFRSHRNLKAAEARSQMRQYSIQHIRQGSQDSISSSTSSRPSMDSTRAPAPRIVSSTNWDPLRLHPPMETGQSPHVPDETAQSQNYRRSPVDSAYGDDFFTTIPISPSTPPSSRRTFMQPSRSRSYGRQQTPSLEIYAGFDFGFGSGPSPGNMNRHLVNGSHHHHHHTPASPSTSTISDFEEERNDTHTPAITPRPQKYDVDTPDYFMKRGDWKRRGIIFCGAEDAGVTEEDCFDLP